MSILASLAGPGEPGVAGVEPMSVAAYEKSKNLKSGASFAGMLVHLLTIFLKSLLLSIAIQAKQESLQGRWILWFQNLADHTCFEAEIRQNLPFTGSAHHCR